jgi:Flp pilus assembly protein TadG
MKTLLNRSGVAALEMALVAPFLVTVLIAGIDFGGVLLSREQVVRALASSAEYATLAGQNGVTWSTIQTNAQTIASSVTSPFLGTPTVNLPVINNSTGAGSKCCIGSGTWSCSTSSTLTCADGSTPGVYIKVTAQYPVTTLFPTDTFLTGKTMTESIVAPVQ